VCCMIGLVGNHWLQFFVFIFSGKGVDKDEHKAMEWFKYVMILYCDPSLFLDLNLK